MGTKSEVYFALYKLTNSKTGQVYEARGLKNVLRLAGLSEKTPHKQIKNSKKWLIEHVEDPLEWDESSYRHNLYKKTKYKYVTYEERKKLRDPLYEKRKRLRLAGWRNKDGSMFTPEQHDMLMAGDCVICGGKEGIGVDHDHRTGVVRDRLCRRCNLALGYVGDSVERLLQLRDYLIKHNGEIYGKN